MAGGLLFVLIVKSHKKHVAIKLLQLQEFRLCSCFDSTLAYGAENQNRVYRNYTAIPSIVDCTDYDL